MINLNFYKAITEPTTAEQGSVWFDSTEKKIKVKDTDGWVSYADSNTIEHIFVGNREFPAKNVEGVKLDSIEKGVQLPESPYPVNQDNSPEMYNFFVTFLVNAAQASLSGKTTTSYVLSSSEQSTIIEKIQEIPRCFVLEDFGGVFFWNGDDSSLYINCLPGHYVMGSNSHKLSALTAQISGHLVVITIYKNFTPTTSGDGTKYLNDKGVYSALATVASSGSYNDLTNKPDLTMSWSEWN